MQLALDAFMSSLVVKGHTKSWETHERDQQFGENESIDIGKSQRLRKEGNARINKVSAMKSGWAKIFDKVRWYFESPEADLHIGENAYYINYANAWLPKPAHWVSKNQSAHCCTSDYGCEDLLERYSRVAWAGLAFTVIHTRVVSKLKIQWILAAIHNSGRMDDCQLWHRSIEAIWILDPLDVEEAYSHIASRYHSIQWHVPSPGWHHASFGQEEHSMARRPVIRGEESWTDDVQILLQNESNDGHAFNFRRRPWSFQKVAIIYNVGQANVY